MCRLSSECALLLNVGEGHVLLIPILQMTNFFGPAIYPGTPPGNGGIEQGKNLFDAAKDRVFHDWLFEPQLVPQLRLQLDIKLGQEIKLGSELDVKSCIGPRLDIQLCPNLCLNLAST